MISVVICSIDDTKFSNICVNITKSFDCAVEIIRIDDAKSLASGYNKGCKIAHGDTLVFCHDDIEIISKDFFSKFIDYHKLYDVIGIVGASKIICGSWFNAGRPYISGNVLTPTSDSKFKLQVFDDNMKREDGIKIIDGLFMSVKRNVFDTVGGFNESLCTGFHIYDIDFSFRSYLAGFKSIVMNDVLMLHNSPPLTNENPVKLMNWVIDKQKFDTLYQDKFDKLSSVDPNHYNVVFDTKEEAYTDFKRIRGIR